MHILEEASGNGNAYFTQEKKFVKICEQMEEKLQNK